jgi:thiol-disulfide isomerase/thioredoxin
MRARLWRRGVLAVWATLLLLAISAVLPVRAAEPAPDYAAAMLDGQGDLSLAALRGEVVLLNTWATWCRPCREEMPLLQQLRQDYGDQGLRVVGVSID